MTSFKDMRELLFLSHGLNFIDNEEFLVLFDLFESKNPDFPYGKYREFALDEMAESECMSGRVQIPEERCCANCRCSQHPTDISLRARIDV